MPLTYFPVTGTIKAVVSDTSADVDGTPDIQNVSSFVYFKPSHTQLYSNTDHVMYRIDVIRARTTPDDGQLKNSDGKQVSHPANTPELDVDEHTYTVSFSNVVYAEAPQQIKAFKFVAPTDNTPIDLATVARLPA